MNNQKKAKPDRVSKPGSHPSLTIISVRSFRKFPSVNALDHEVSIHTKKQHARQNVELDVCAQEVAVGEGDDEAQRFPHAVVGEGCLRLFREQNTVDSWK